MKTQWIKFVTRVDILIQEALRVSARRSMRSGLVSLKAGRGDFAFLSKNIFIDCAVDLKMTEVLIPSM